MRKPRGVDSFALIIEKIKDKSADKKTEEGEKKYTYVKISRGHSAVVYGEHQGAEAVGEGLGNAFLQYNKAKPSEKYFFKQGIDHRYIQRNVEKIILAHSRVRGELSRDDRKIYSVPKNKIGGKKKYKDSHAYAEPFGDVPLLWNEHLFQQWQIVAVYYEIARRHREKKNYLYG